LASPELEDDATKKNLVRLEVILVYKPLFRGAKTEISAKHGGEATKCEIR